MGRVVFSFINLINELIHYPVTPSSGHLLTLFYSLNRTKSHPTYIFTMVFNKTITLVTGELYSPTK